MQTTRELSISLVPYSPLARGLVTSTLDVSILAEDDFRRTLPRYQKENISNNNKLVKEFTTFAQTKGCTPSHLALAWVLAQGDHIIPIPGTKKRKYLEENIGAIEVNLSDIDLVAIDGLIKQYPVIGERYSEASMKMVNR